MSKLTMGKHEREALERERDDLMRRVNKTQMDGRRLDQIEELLGGKITYDEFYLKNPPPLAPLPEVPQGPITHG